MENSMNKLIHGDSRDIGILLNKDVIIQTTITSPPYFDMKDYGVDHQIGYGQQYEDYLNDLCSVFALVWNQTCDNGTLWIVIDTFKRNGVVVPLPFDLASKLKEIGWLLQDVIIWKKDKTVPWSNSGFMQRKFEYVLLFSKTKTFKSRRDSVRVFDTAQLKKWWVKYPERYNPKGRALEEIWEHPIPVQGSWGKKYIRHFCPLPKEMVANMIQISSDENDVVFDPFAGSGTVLAQAAYMKRRYLGIELNEQYIQMFRTYLDETLKDGLRDYETTLNNCEQQTFEQTIKNLRALKFGRMLWTKLSLDNSTKLYVEITGDGVGDKILSARYCFISKKNDPRLDAQIKMLASKPPLSKFGIDYSIEFMKSLPGDAQTKELFCYSKTNSYSYIRNGHWMDKNVVLVSPICVQLNDKDYDY